MLGNNSVACVAGGYVLAEMICVLNGPNLNLLGMREPEIYRHETLQNIEALCSSTAEKAGFLSGFCSAILKGR